MDQGLLADFHLDQSFDPLTINTSQSHSEVPVLHLIIPTLLTELAKDNLIPKFHP